MCTQWYHCLPSQLRAEDWFDIVEHIAISAAIEDARPKDK